MSVSRVYVVDAQPIFVRGVRAAIDECPKLTFLGDGPTMTQGLDQIALSEVDILLIDISVPDFDGVDMKRRIDMMLHPPRVMVFTHLSQSVFVQQAYACGVDGYLLKTASPQILREAIATVLSGGTYLDPRLSDPEVTKEGAQAGPGTMPIGMVDVSSREISVLRLSALGYSCKEIARELNLSPKSIETYKARALSKLGLETRVDIVRFASMCGWYESVH